MIKVNLMTASLRDVLSSRRYREKHPVEYSESQKRYSKEKRKASLARHHQTDKYKNTRLKHRYGISLDDYNRMFEEQDGRCFICRRMFSEDLTPFIDHCHATKKVRGLLCRFCNSGIGMLGESVDTLLRAIEYLRG